MDLLLFKDLYLDHISVEKNASTNTLEAYARDLDKCIVFLSDDESLSSPRDVRLIHLARFFQSLSKAGLAASSQARAQSAVRQLFKWGAKRGHIDADPSRGLQPPKVPRRLPTVLSREQVLTSSRLHRPHILEQIDILLLQRWSCSMHPDCAHLSSVDYASRNSI